MPLTAKPLEGSVRVNDRIGGECQYQRGYLLLRSAPPALPYQQPLQPLEALYLDAILAAYILPSPLPPPLHKALYFVPPVRRKFLLRQISNQLLYLRFKPAPCLARFSCALPSFIFHRAPSF